MTVRWLGVEEPQVFPWGFLYFEGGNREMEIIPKPKAADRAAQQKTGSTLDVAGAADTATPVCSSPMVVSFEATTQARHAWEPATPSTVFTAR